MKKTLHIFILSLLLTTTHLSGYGTSKSSQIPRITSVPSLLETLTTRGTLGLSYNSYSTEENPDNFAFEGNIDISKKVDDSILNANIAVLYDINDHNRRFTLLNEIYYKHQTEDSTFLIGRGIRNWGVMEAYSLSDVFNTKNYLSDSFDMSSKYGALNIEYTHNYNNSHLSIIAKGEEIEQPYPKENNIYNYLPLAYSGSLQTEKNPHRPTFYLKYNTLIDDEIQGDISFILQNGYDSKRYFTTTHQNTALKQYAYIANKAILFGNFAYENTIFKIEAAYTNIIDDKNVSDYYQMSLGAEYQPNQSVNGAELRFLLEYYYYGYADTTKLQYQDFSEIFDNDIFLGTLSNFGDAGSSEIKGGILYDLKNSEQTYILNFSTRMKENYRLSMEWMVLKPGNESLTAIGQMGQFNQVTFRANYFF